MSCGSDCCDIETESSVPLIPGLPDHLAQLCLVKVPPLLLYSVSRSWRRLLYSPSFPPFISLYFLLSPPPLPPRPPDDDDHHPQSEFNNSNSIEFISLDPISSKWEKLPPPLPQPPQQQPLHLLHRHPSFLSRNLPIQSVRVSNCLVLIAATTHRLVPALSRPLIFNPKSNTWLYGPPFTIPRRWCATGSLAGKVYMGSGFGSNYHGYVARSMEQWDMNEKVEKWEWKPMVSLKDGRFSREAVDIIGYKGKLHMVNVKGNAVKEGAVYDVERKEWEEMPPGMLEGWTGPAGSTEEGDAMYVVDEVKGALCEYDSERDCWVKLIELNEFRLAEQVVVALRGKVCVVCANAERVVVVDGVARPARVVRVVEPPRSGQKVVALHALPRMLSESFH